MAGTEESWSEGTGSLKDEERSTSEDIGSWLDEESSASEFSSRKPEEKEEEGSEEKTCETGS